MSKISKVIAPTNNVNDTSVVICEFLVEDGAEVKEKQAVINVETSKTTIDIKAPTFGYIKFVVSIGDEIPNGGLLAVIGDSKEELQKYGKEEKTEVSSLAIEQKTEIVPSLTSTKSTEFGIFDNPVTLGEIYRKSGERIEAGAALCKVRDENKVQLISAVVSGYVHWNVEPYESCSAKQPIGYISDSPVATELKKHNEFASFRVSKEAKRILDERHLSAATLGLTGLVTANMVKERLHSVKKTVNVEPEIKDEMPVTHSTSGHYEKLSKAKRAEAKYLTDANKKAVISQVSVLVPTQGVITACLNNPELSNRFSSIIVFETGRLLKNYRHMTSCYDNGQLYVYNHINIGYALSVDDGLKVPVIKDVDQKDLDSIIAEKENLIEKYISSELSTKDLENGSFTITDLSSTGCYYFNPVLNLGQSVILGVGGENPERTNYPLILAFDHRVIDGATAMEFLNKLKERLIAHENVLLEKPTKKENGDPRENDGLVDTENLMCDACYRTAEELDQMGHYLLKVLDKGGKEKRVCSICMRGW